MKKKLTISIILIIVGILTALFLNMLLGTIVVQAGWITLFLALTKQELSKNSSNYHLVKGVPIETKNAGKKWLFVLIYEVVTIILLGLLWLLLNIFTKDFLQSGQSVYFIMMGGAIVFMNIFVGMYIGTEISAKK